jgi:hypothetical protein
MKKSFIRDTLNGSSTLWLTALLLSISTPAGDHPVVSAQYLDWNLSRHKILCDRRGAALLSAVHATRGRLALLLALALVWVSAFTLGGLALLKLENQRPPPPPAAPVNQPWLSLPLVKHSSFLSPNGEMVLYRSVPAN